MVGSYDDPGDFLNVFEYFCWVEFKGNTRIHTRDDGNAVASATQEKERGQ